MDHFLPEDLEALDRAIDRVKQEINKALKEAGDSCGESSETWHDNPGYEEGQRAATMWSTRLRQLLAIRQQVNIIPYPRRPAPDGRACIGHSLLLQDLATGKKQEWQLGSAMTFGESEYRVSYQSPLGQVLLGATVGDLLQVDFGGRTTSLLVLDVK